MEFKLTKEDFTIMKNCVKYCSIIACVIEYICDEHSIVRVSNPSDQTVNTNLCKKQAGTLVTVKHFNKIVKNNIYDEICSNLQRKL